MIRACLTSLALSLVLGIGGCANALTELVVVIDTDYLPADPLDEVAIAIMSPEGAPAPVVVSLPGRPLPLSLGVVHRGGPLGPLTIEATGSADGVIRVRRTVSTSFVLGETREVRLDLWRACEGVPCPEEATCVAGTCTSIFVPGSDLPVYRGDQRLDASSDATVSSLDATYDAPDAPSDAIASRPDVRLDTPDARMVDASMADASDVGVSDGGRPDGGMPDGGMPDGGRPDGGRPDAGAMPDGGCSCTLDHAVAACVAGGCTIVSCAMGYSDCDGSNATGCERFIRTLDDCGACDRACTSSDGTTSCSDGVCRIVTCSDSGQGDCNGAVSDGCETRIDHNDDANCGACARRCPTGERCNSGTCR